MAEAPRADTVLLDVDGTLMDTTYHHAMAWHRAFRSRGVDVPIWRVHRAIGMGGDRLVAEVAGDEVEERLGDELRQAWEREYEPLRAEIAPLPHA
ncbi:MAG: HAD family hydrolase, partial [Oryzihumus sp.]